MHWERLLRVAGQPQQRTRAWSWCVREDGNFHAADVAELTRGGRVELIGSTARLRRAAGIPIGAKADRLGDDARSLGGGVFVRPRHGAQFTYFVHGGRVRAVAVATRKLAHHASALRAAMHRLVTARATESPRRFVPNAAQRSGKLIGGTLAGSSNPRLNRALAILCGAGH
jgi:hypothetical protein